MSKLHSLYESLYGAGSIFDFFPETPDPFDGKSNQELLKEDFTKVAKDMQKATEMLSHGRTQK